MDKSKKQQASGLLETKSLASALPEKSVEQRPKYVQILQQEKSVASPHSTPSKSPTFAALGANSSGDSTAQVDSTQKPLTKKPVFKKNNNNKDLIIPNGKPQQKRPFRVYVKKQEVVGLPSEVAVREFPITPENVVYFNGSHHFLSALYPVTIVVDGNEYNSVEHYYQACKLYTLVNENSAAALKAAGTPIDVKKATKVILKQEKVPPAKINEWKDKDSIGVLKHVILHKFSQNEELKKNLLETGDKILIQTYIGDTYFAAGAGYRYTSNWVTRHTNQSVKYPEVVSAENVKYLPLIANGKNALGWILMQVRDEIRTNSA
ncbi:unnamed protein product [Caenorhabditis brenneri]